MRLNMAYTHQAKKRTSPVKSAPARSKSAAATVPLTRDLGELALLPAGLNPADQEPVLYPQLEVSDRLTDNRQMARHKYKDDLPINTVNRVRNLLGDLQVFTVETGWKNSVPGFYSVTVGVKDTTLTTNGKGAAAEYALASAYGELMERLQNMAHFRLSMDMSPRALQYGGFYYAPDEKQLSVTDFLNSQEDWSRQQLARVHAGIDIEELLKVWINVSYEETPADFLALPYVNLMNGEQSYIPIKMLSKMYMSNGMCAGNTPEEALVQGISEVFERYANKTIIKDKLTPPTIPRDYLDNYPHLKAMISGIEASGINEVIIKDCSLGQGFPVILVIFINKPTQSYFIKLGAHPIFEIAVERTLTELLQGQDINNMMGLTRFCYKTELEDEFANLIGILVNGVGVYPSTLFRRQPDYEFKPFINPRDLSNKGLLSHVLDLLREKNLDVLVRDNSFLGFPAFHVIVPGMSEVEEFDDLKSLQNYAAFNRVKRFIREPHSIPGHEDELVADLKELKYRAANSIPQLLNLPLSLPLPWYYSSIDLFITALYYRKRDFARAYAYLDKYLKEMVPTPMVTSFPVYFQCVRDYIGTRIDGLAEADAVYTLNRFYPANMVTGVISEFKNPEMVFERHGQLNCWNCGQCPFRVSCSYAELDKVYRALKEQVAANPIDQSWLMSILN